MRRLSDNNSQGKEKVRITLVLPKSLDQNLKLFACASGKLQSEVLIDALSDFLARQGFEPHTAPVQLTTESTRRPLSFT